MTAPEAAVFTPPDGHKRPWAGPRWVKQSSERRYSEFHQVTQGMVHFISPKLSMASAANMRLLSLFWLAAHLVNDLWNTFQFGPWETTSLSPWWLYNCMCVMHTTCGVEEKMHVLCASQTNISPSMDPHPQMHRLHGQLCLLKIIWRPLQSCCHYLWT
jgi:hypothetical protein